MPFGRGSRNNDWISTHNGVQSLPGTLKLCLVFTVWVLEEVTGYHNPRDLLFGRDLFDRLQ
jgi:hypothetical protein